MNQEKFWNETKPEDIMPFFGFDPSDERERNAFAKAVWYMDLEALWDSPDFQEFAKALKKGKRK